MLAQLARRSAAPVALSFVLIVYGALARAQDAPPSGQTRQAGTLTDHDYAFALRAPVGWRILEQSAIARVLPDGVAVLSTDSGTAVGVIADPMPAGQTLAGMAELIIAKLETVDHAEFERHESTFLGMPAIRIHYGGSYGGKTLVAEHHVFARARFLYQVVAWSTAVEGADEEIAAGIAAFSLIDGEPRVREYGQNIRDQLGFEWEVHRGTYTSLMYGLTVTPPSEWRIVLGSELDQTKAHAIVGLSRRDGRFHVVVEAEHLRGVALERWPEETAAEEWRKIGVAARTTLDGDQRIEVARTALNFTFAKRFFTTGEVGVRLSGWANDTDPTDMDAIAPAFASVRAATDDELAAARQRSLARAPASSAAFEHAFVWPSACYRPHVFTHFDLGVTLEVPRDGTGWAVDASDSVRSEFGAATLVVCHAPLFGVWLKLEAVTFGESDSPVVRAAHDSALEVEAASLAGVEHTEATWTALAGHVARFSRFDYDLPAGRGSKCLWTAIDRKGRRAFWVTVWGRSANIEAAQADIERLVAGLRTSPSALPTTTTGPGRFQDHVFGFTIDTRRNPDGTLSRDVEPLDSIVDLTPPAAPTVNRVLSVVERDGFACAVSAVCLPSFSKSEEDVLDSFATYLPEPYRSELPAKRSALQRTPWLGHDALLLRLGTDELGADLRVVKRGRLAYYMLTEGTLAERERMAHWLTLDEPGQDD